MKKKNKQRLLLLQGLVFVEQTTSSTKEELQSVVADLLALLVPSLLSLLWLIALLIDCLSSVQRLAGDDTLKHD